MTGAFVTTQQHDAASVNPGEPPAMHAALLFDWDGDDLDRLRRMMSRKGVDLETAAQVFFNGAPERYNMIAKTDLLPQVQARCNLLDSIHRRIACGFYLPDPERGLGRARRQMQDWINRQRSEGAAGRSGRWVFDGALLELQLTGPARPVIVQRPVEPAPLDSLWTRLMRLIRRDRQVKPTCELEN
ncbi:MAG: hypothetical protein LPK02_05955 [Rhodobacterales bacterium]|nr:hypothetical protein [Rhodobacterales bacterium]MDX5412570.1 hypothetical protein [Rhodobacterales bacterium]